MKPTETRLVSPTGGAKGAKDIRLGGADALALLELGRVYGMGEKKYDRFNYLKGYPWSLSIDAMMRHLLAFMAGQEYDECSIHPGQHGDEHAYDPEVCDGSGLLHTAHVAWHGLTLTSFQQRNVGEDDRFHEPVPPPSWVLTGQLSPEEEDRLLANAWRSHLDRTGFIVPLSQAQVTSGEDVSVEVNYRGEDPVETRVAGRLTCCGATEHTLACPQYR